jgi:phage recombination protein Bet
MSNAITTRHKQSLVESFAKKYSIDPDKLLPILKATAFKQREGAITNEQMAALLVVADQYGLNPFTREIYAFPDKNNGIVPVVGIDGWARIINQHPDYDGLEFIESDEIVTLPGAKPCPSWISCVIYRKDRQRPTPIKEYIDEVYRPPFEGNGKNGSYKVSGPWQTHTKRFLRHKALIQCARIAFGFAGIYDQDEAERIIEGQIIENESHEQNVDDLNTAIFKDKTEPPKDKQTKPEKAPEPDDLSDWYTEELE